MNINPSDIEKMSSREVDEIIQEWQEIPGLEKLRNRLMFVNHVSHPEEAHLMRTPPFLEKFKNKLGLPDLDNSSSVKKKRGRKRKPASENNIKHKTIKKSTTNIVGKAQLMPTPSLFKNPNDKSTMTEVVKPGKTGKAIGRKRKTDDDCTAKIGISKKAAQDIAEKVRKNPERSSKMVVSNYHEEEIPEDDRYIFCDNCQKEVLDYCDTCGMLVVIKDVKVPVGVPDRAQKTVPQIFEIRESNIHGLGVFVKFKLPQGIQLGPYEGTVTRVPNTNGYSWKLRNGKLVDAGDETMSNWMRYVNCASHVSAQNVVAFQYRGELFYRTARTIEKGEELLVYYGNSFAKELGIEPKKYFDPQIESELKPFYTCKHCQLGLSSQKFRDAHEKRCTFGRQVYHTGDTFACAHCDVLFGSNNDRDVHEKRCKRKPNSKKKSEFNVLRQINGKQYICHECRYETNNKYYFAGHKLIHDKENAPHYRCSICSFTTLRKGDLSRHLRIHSSFALICKCCQKCFKQKVALDSHYVSKHQDKYNMWKHLITYNINRCENHILTHESDSEKYHCQVCEYKSIQKGNFKKHLRTHIDQLPFVCTECKKRYSEKKSLDYHILNQHSDNAHLTIEKTCFKNHISTQEDKCDMRKHLITNKINQCPICPYKTLISSHLKNHILTHESDSEKYHCQVCDYKSIQKGNFKRHLRIHVDQLPFVCTECRRRFNGKQSLDGHILSRHWDNAHLMNTMTSRVHNCSQCNYRTVIATNLKTHLKTCFNKTFL